MQMLTDQELDHIASLARIKLEDKEREGLKKDLSSILDYVAKLEEVDTSSVEPLYQTTSIVSAMRKDEHDGELEKGIKKGELLKVKSVFNR